MSISTFLKSRLFFHVNRTVVITVTVDITQLSVGSALRIHVNVTVLLIAMRVRAVCNVNL